MTIEQLKTLHDLLIDLAQEIYDRGGVGGPAYAAIVEATRQVLICTRGFHGKEGDEAIEKWDR